MLTTKLEAALSARALALHRSHCHLAAHTNAPTNTQTDTFTFTRKTLGQRGSLLSAVHTHLRGAPSCHRSFTSATTAAGSGGGGGGGAAAAGPGAAAKCRARPLPVWHKRCYENSKSVLSAAAFTSRCCSFFSSLSLSSTECAVSSFVPSSLRLCIVGSGPAGMYTAKYLLKQFADIRIDIYERFCAPYGLVRNGVAPDHPDVKSVSNDFDVTLADVRVRYFGNVTVGGLEGKSATIQIKELKEYYHAIVLAYGAESEKALNIPGENELKGIVNAREFVNWYNSHPQHAKDSYPLKAAHTNSLPPLSEALIESAAASHAAAAHTAVIVGQGNVAVDVARILLTPTSLLKNTDINNSALSALSESSFLHVQMVARRGPVQSACTIAEIRELNQYAQTTQTPPTSSSSIPSPAAFLPAIRWDEWQAGLNGASQTELETSRPKRRKADLLESIAKNYQQILRTNSLASFQRLLSLRFFLSPKEFFPAADNPSKVGGIIFDRTRLEGPPDQQIAVPTGSTEKIYTNFVLKSIGYKSLPIAGVPFDKQRNVIPSEAGRVTDSEHRSCVGLYVTGWLKRGPSGIIGTNIVDARETVKSLAEDIQKNVLNSPDKVHLDPPVIATQQSRAVGGVIDKQGWMRIDAFERQTGKQNGKVREKLSELKDFLRVAAIA